MFDAAHHKLSCAAFAGLWQRRVIYEPRDTVQDSAADGSRVFWMQSPHGPYIDVRCIKNEAWVCRGFTGVLRVTDKNDADRTASLTWTRHLDSKPSSCPGGVDTAVARWVAHDVLMEEGDGYLEVWERVAQWDAMTSSALWVSDDDDGCGKSVPASSEQWPRSNACVLEMRVGEYIARAFLSSWDLAASEEVSSPPLLMQLCCANERHTAHAALVQVTVVQS